MPSNRSNVERGKAFAIGTKIEDNGKLYEVTESNQCCDCSLAAICSSSDDKFKSKLMEAYNKGLREVGRKILIENNITPNKTIDIACTPISFEPISARINKNNEVILIGYLYQDRTDYKVRKEYKLNDLF
jgi:hypothetical protein